MCKWRQPPPTRFKVLPPPHQEIRDVELVAPHPGIDIMEEEQQDVQMASTSADPLQGITSATRKFVTLS
jgi:hypothetical protein